MTMKIGTTAVAIAAAFSITAASKSFAQDASASAYNGDANYQREAQDFDAASQMATDDIYADIIDVTGRGPGGWPGGPPPGGGWGPGHGGGPGGGPPPGGGWGPGHGGGGWSRGVQCRAINMRGMAFYGQGRNMPEARDAAMWNCQRVSRRCEMDGCQPL